EGALEEPGHQTFGWRAADAGDRAHPAYRRQLPDAGRADRGTRARHHPADRPDHRAAEEGGFHDPTGRAELPLRRHRRRPLLHRPPRKDHRRLRQSRAEAKYEKATPQSRRLETKKEQGPPAPQMRRRIHPTGIERDLSMQALYAQLLVGLINGSFYALLSLGLAVIFGMLNIINFAHGALYMMGAFCAYFLLSLGGIGYWWALIIAPIAVGIFGMILERTMLQWLTGLDHLYALLLTFGFALIVQGVFQNFFGSSGLPYAIPDELKGGMNLGFMFLPIYRGWVVIFSLVVCLATWFLIEKTRLGAYLRAATEN